MGQHTSAILTFDFEKECVTVGQNSPVDFPDTLQDIFRLLGEAGFNRCMLLLHSQVTFDLAVSYKIEWRCLHRLMHPVSICFHVN